MAKTDFELNTTSTYEGIFHEYGWSTAANWSNGIPANGDTVVLVSTAYLNPASYDDIGNLFLDDLNVRAGILAVATTLTVADLDFTTTETGVFQGVYADTLLEAGPGASASLTVDAITGGYGRHRRGDHGAGQHRSG